MTIEVVKIEPRPMLFVTRSTTMAPEEISGVMGEAFTAIGGFIGQAGITPAGPPLAVYRDMAAGRMKVDVGFAVTEVDAAKAAGEVQAGTTPSGEAFMTVHRGPYAKLRETYGVLAGHMMKAGVPTATLAWEVYITDPDKTPESDLLTEVYMR